MHTAFIDDLGADSLDVYEIISAIEDTFDISIDPEEADSIITIQDAVEGVKRAQGR